MTRLIRDETLEQMVRELNRSQDVEDAGPALTPSAVPEGAPLERLLLEMAQRGASDLLLVSDNPPILRVGGRLSPIDAPPLDGAEIAALFAGFLTRATRDRLETEGSADFSLRLSPSAVEDDRPAWRFRVNVHRQRGTLAAAVRVLPAAVPTLTGLNLPPVLAELVKTTRGLVLVCGPTGSGKTTTLSAMVGEINRTDARHIITIEDPIEYEHRNDRSIIEQIDVGRDAPSFAAALRSALRQDPDVILVGEMRDLETVAIALTAAETGHLILSTLHTSDAAQAINRIIDVFPSAQQNQVRQQLALSLHAVVCQQLIPRADTDGRAVATEVLLANQPVRNHIRQGKLQHFTTEITLGRRQGMVTLEDSLARLVRSGMITPDEARIRASRPDELESLLR